MGRPPCCDKSNVKRGLWTPEEDAKILAHVAAHGTGNWTSVPKKAGLKRCGKSCRLRWTNYLRPDLKHDKFTPQEEELIVNLHSTLGSRWSLIAGQLPGRTDNDVKNYWNTKLKKKLKEMGIDPVTHKPFSQILTEYANISGLPKSSSSRIGSLNRDLKNKVIFKSSSEQPLSPIIPQEYSIPNITNHCSMVTRAPKMEPLMMQDITSPHNNNSLELLAQLQAINMVQPANAPINCIYNQDFSTVQPTGNYFFSTEASVSSSSSSSNIIQKNSSQPGFPSPADTTPSSPFSWSEFLLEDLCFPPNDQTQEDVTGGGLSSTGSSEKEFVIDNGIYNNNFHGFGNAGHGHMTVSSVETGNVLAGMTSSSLDDSFMDMMLDQDSELSWDFPSLLEEQYFY